MWDAGRVLEPRKITRSRRLFEAGLICRADDRGEPAVQLSPPPIAGQAEFDEATGILGEVLSEAETALHGNK